MPENTPQPIPGWFIPNPPSKPKPSLLARIAVGAGVGLAIVLASPGADGTDPATAPSTPPSTTSPTTAAAKTP